MRTSSLRQFGAAVRLLVLLTVLLGVLYPLGITAVAQLPGLKARAEGSLVTGADGQLVGSTLIGQLFLDGKGNAIPTYFQSRPSAAGKGYDPTATSASNLGPESVTDTLPDPNTKDDTGKQSLLTQVCARSLAVGELEKLDGARPFCAPSGVGAVLAVSYAGPGYTGAVTRAVSINEACPDGAKPFIAQYDGVAVTCATFGQDYTSGKIVPIRGDAPAQPAVPADAVTASGSGLDPEISPAYAALQVARVAAARRITPAQVQAVVASHTAGRDLGFLGEPRVNVLQVNRDLDARYPAAS